MKKPMAVIIMCMLLLVLGACTTKTANIRFLQNTELQIPHLPGEGRVEGKDCSLSILFFSWSRPRVDLAIANSIDKRNQKYNGLADAEIIYSSKAYLHHALASKECILVVGRPVLLEKPAAPVGTTAIR